MDWRDVLVVILWQNEYEDEVRRCHIKDAAYTSGLWDSTDDDDILWNVEHQMKASFVGKLEHREFRCIECKVTLIFVSLKVFTGFLLLKELNKSLQNRFIIRLWPASHTHLLLCSHILHISTTELVEMSWMNQCIPQFHRQVCWILLNSSFPLLHSRMPS
jgi:hypothetical protein